MALDRGYGGMGRPGLPRAILGRGPRCPRVPRRLPRSPAAPDGPELLLPSPSEGQPAIPPAGLAERAARSAARATRDGCGAPSSAAGSPGGRTGPRPPGGGRPAAGPRPAPGPLALGGRCSPPSVMQRLSRNASAAWPTHHLRGVGGAHSHSPAAPLPQLPLHSPQALPSGEAPAPAAPYRQPPLSQCSSAVHLPAPQYSLHPQPAHHTFARSPTRATPWSTVARSGQRKHPR